MPLLFLGAGALGGFVLGKGTEGLSSIIKWGVIGGGVYVGAKALKVL